MARGKMAIASVKSKSKSKSKSASTPRKGETLHGYIETEVFAKPNLSDYDSDSTESDEVDVVTYDTSKSKSKSRSSSTPPHVSQGKAFKVPPLLEAELLKYVGTKKAKYLAVKGDGDCAYSAVLESALLTQGQPDGEYPAAVPFRESDMFDGNPLKGDLRKQARALVLKYLPPTNFGGRERPEFRVENGAEMRKWVQTYAEDFLGEGLELCLTTQEDFKYLYQIIQSSEKIVSEETLERIVEGEWAQNEELQLMSDILGVKIVVYSESAAGGGPSTARRGRKKGGAPVIYSFSPNTNTFLLGSNWNFNDVVLFLYNKGGAAADGTSGFHFDAIIPEVSGQLTAFTSRQITVAEQTKKIYLDNLKKLINDRFGCIPKRFFRISDAWDWASTTQSFTLDSDETFNQCFKKSFLLSQLENNEVDENNYESIISTHPVAMQMVTYRPPSRPDVEPSPPKVFSDLLMKGPVVLPFWKSASIWDRDTGQVRTFQKYPCTEAQRNTISEAFKIAQDIGNDEISITVLKQMKDIGKLHRSCQDFIAKEAEAAYVYVDTKHDRINKAWREEEENEKLAIAARKYLADPTSTARYHNFPRTAPNFLDRFKIVGDRGILYEDEEGRPQIFEVRRIFKGTVHTLPVHEDGNVNIDDDKVIWTSIHFKDIDLVSSGQPVESALSLSLSPDEERPLSVDEAEELYEEFLRELTESGDGKKLDPEEVEELKKIIMEYGSEAEKEAISSLSESISKQHDCSKIKCSEEKICNPLTGRCVLKSGEIGQDILMEMDEEDEEEEEDEIEEEEAIVEAIEEEEEAIEEEEEEEEAIEGAIEEAKEEVTVVIYDDKKSKSQSQKESRDKKADRRREQRERYSKTATCRGLGKGVKGYHECCRSKSATNPKKCKGMKLGVKEYHMCCRSGNPLKMPKRSKKKSKTSQTPKRSKKTRALPKRSLSESKKKTSSSTKEMSSMSDEPLQVIGESDKAIVYLSDASNELESLKLQSDAYSKIPNTFGEGINVGDIYFDSSWDTSTHIQPNRGIEGTLSNIAKHGISEELEDNTNMKWFVDDYREYLTTGKKMNSESISRLPFRFYQVGKGQKIGPEYNPYYYSLDFDVLYVNIFIARDVKHVRLPGFPTSRVKNLDKVFKDNKEFLDDYQIDYVSVIPQNSDGGGNYPQQHVPVGHAVGYEGIPKSFSDMHSAQLKEMATLYDIKRRSKMKKKELIDALCVRGDHVGPTV